MIRTFGVRCCEPELVPPPTLTLVPIELEDIATALVVVLRELGIRPTVFEVSGSLGAMVPLSGAECEDSPETVLPLVVLVGGGGVSMELLLVPYTEVEEMIELDPPKLLLEEGVWVMLASDVGSGRAGGSIGIV